MELDFGMDVDVDMYDDLLQSQTISATSYLATTTNSSTSQHASSGNATSNYNDATSTDNINSDLNFTSGGVSVNTTSGLFVPQRISLTAAGLPRKRERLACDRCRAHKRKCDGMVIDTADAFTDFSDL
jgi:hypothetical protein